MTTFSQLVDEMVAETKRPDLVSEIVSYTNQTIRELHFDPERNCAVLFDSNRNERQLVVDVEDNFVWNIEDITTFQQMEAVRYDGQFDTDGEQIYPERVNPGRAIRFKLFAYYRTGQSFAFKGCGNVGSIVSISFFAYPRALKYYAPDQRPASYDLQNGWTYATGIDTPELREAAEIATSNWLLLRWKICVEEGVRAKVYKRVGDETRSRTSYSLYAQLRKGLFTSEAAGNGDPML